MQLEYKTKKLKTECENLNKAVKSYGRQNGEKLHLRIDQLVSADSVEDLIQYGIGRCHELLGNRSGQYAIDLVHPFRLVFTKSEKSSLAKINIIRIMEVTDYHGK